MSVSDMNCGCRGFLVMILLCVIPSCSREQMPDGPRVPVVPVTGLVMIDGEAAKHLAVTCHLVGEKPETVPMSSAFTDEIGQFRIGTFEAGDGAPPGQYKITFEWGQINLMSGRYEGDKLNGAYADPETSEFSFSLQDGEPLDLGLFELTPGKAPPKKSKSRR